MTKKNLNLNAEDEGVFLLEPAIKETIWGGNKLKEKYGKKSNTINIAESWECSVHPSGLSKISNGKYKGKCLKDILIAHPEYLGEKIKNVDDFPFLIKFIDAKKKLSVQVHPSDEYAKKYEHGASGKTEMWYIIEAENNAELVYGFYDDITKQQLIKSIDNGEIEKYLNKVRTKPNDVFFIPSGTVHGIGAGNLILEVQENSDITYRIYDYNRIDKNGNKRKLHIEKALDAVNYKKLADIRQPMRLLKYQHCYAKEFLCRCEYFTVERIIINSEEEISLELDRDICVFVCIDGKGKMFLENGRTLNIQKGNSVFISNLVKKIAMLGNMTLIKVAY